jgi:hypothetical protein
MRRAGDGHDLIKRLLMPDHTEIGACSFFGSLGTLFKVYDFRIERLIALAQLFVLDSLPDNGFAQITCFAKTVGREPQLALQCERCASEDHEHPA